MSSVAFCVPVRAGKLPDALKLADAITSNMAEGHDETHRAHGVRRVKIYHQKRPNEAVIIYIEADDIRAAMRNRAASEHEFDDWFAKMIEDITGYHPDLHFHEPPSEILIDWHEQHGHKHRAEHT